MAQQSGGIALVGGGSLGSSLARALIKQRMVTPSRLIVVERDSKRRAALRRNTRCNVLESPVEALKAAPLWILCVKPQDAAFACSQLRPFLPTRTLVISMMAGVRIATLRRRLGHARIARVMPNLGLNVCKSMSVYRCAPRLSSAERRQVARLLECFGSVIEVKRERLIDAATALSGSGPGYLYYLLERLLRISRGLGFSEKESELLARQTIEGALGYWANSNLTPRELCRMVSSPGGTTLAALAEFERGKLALTLQSGIHAALRRSLELNR